MSIVFVVLVLSLLGNQWAWMLKLGCPRNALPCRRHKGTVMSQHVGQDFRLHGAGCVLIPKNSGASPQPRKAKLCAG